MEQRYYHGSVNAEELANYLVQHFDPLENHQAQKLGSGDSLIVQIAHGDFPQDRRHAISLGITTANDGQGVTVTMGQQQWLTPAQGTFTAMMALVALLATPWALFALIWPLSDVIASQGLPQEIWSAVEVFAGSRGATLADSTRLQHPHAS